MSSVAKKKFRIDKGEIGLSGSPSEVCSLGHRDGIRYGSVRWANPASETVQDVSAFRVLVDNDDSTIWASGEARTLLPAWAGKPHQVSPQQTALDLDQDGLRNVSPRRCFCCDTSSLGSVHYPSLYRLGLFTCQFFLELGQVPNCAPFVRRLFLGSHLDSSSYVKRRFLAASRLTGERHRPIQS
jgi:hypothetical protein